MKRFTGVRILTQATSESDVAVFIGKEICEEAAPYLSSGSYLMFSDEEDYLLSMTLGMAMCTDKRVFVFCEEHYFIRNLSEVLQIGVSKCRNLFIIFFCSGEYIAAPGLPTVFDSANNQHGIFYNMGMLVHDYKNQFKFSRNPIKFVRETWDRVKGPIAIIMKTERGSKQLPEIDFSDRNSIEATREFILDENIKAHDFVPPIDLSNFED
jgi:hypothetical protein